MSSIHYWWQVPVSHLTLHGEWPESSTFVKDHWTPVKKLLPHVPSVRKSGFFCEFLNASGEEGLLELEDVLHELYVNTADDLFRLCKKPMQRIDRLCILMTTLQNVKKHLSRSDVPDRKERVACVEGVMDYLVSKVMKPPQTSIFDKADRTGVKASAAQRKLREEHISAFKKTIRRLCRKMNFDVAKHKVSLKKKVKSTPIKHRGRERLSSDVTPTFKESRRGRLPVTPASSREKLLTSSTPLNLQPKLILRRG